MLHSYVEVARQKIGGHSLRHFPERDEYLDTLYLVVARAYLDPRDLRPQRCADDETRRLRVRRLLGLPGAALPRDCALAWPKSWNPRKDLATCRHRLQLAHRPLELVWLFHEGSKLCLQLGHFGFAR